MTQRVDSVADTSPNVLVMGVGNTLLRDDGIGIHVTEALRSSSSRSDWNILDGGTIGLALLPEIENADAVVIVDAAEIGAEPGTVQVFRNGEIDQLLARRRRSVHEVALVDLFSAAAIRGHAPAERALVAIQPADTGLGLQPTPAVREAIPRACDAVAELTRSWQHER